MRGQSNDYIKLQAAGSLMCLIIESDAGRSCGNGGRSRSRRLCGKKGVQQMMAIRVFLILRLHKASRC